MRRTMTLLGAAGVLFAMSGCRQFLDSKELKVNPNDPSTASTGPLFTGAEANLYSQVEGQLGRTVALWMQSFSGQASPFNNLSLYQYGVDDYLNNWGRVYGGGGLIDLRTIEQRSLAAGDSIFAGQAIVLEAMQISMAADIWGDIPYAQASQPTVYKTPKVDAQQTVYDSLLTTLAKATVYMAATGPTNAGALGYDNLSGVGSSTDAANPPAFWTAVANTLRARLWMHLAARVGPAAYDSATSAALAGIRDSTGASDFTSVHGNTAVTANIWSDFQSIYAGDLVAASTIIGIMSADNDPRLPLYWALGDDSTYYGTPPAVVPNDPSQPSSLSATRSAQTFGQPIVTYAENQLILAEAACQLGNRMQALTYLNGERASAGATPIGAISLQAIMNEKYVALFQNVEVWNDFKRTGFPTMVGPPVVGPPPRRMTYPASEREANPNIPADGARNWNDTGPVSSNCG
jgi:Starch-binding associating with outer membrane/Susd and RagB outer membrane lipoprotein